MRKRVSSARQRHLLLTTTQVGACPHRVSASDLPVCLFADFRRCCLARFQAWTAATCTFSTRSHNGECSAEESHQLENLSFSWTPEVRRLQLQLGMEGRVHQGEQAGIANACHSRWNTSGTTRLAGCPVQRSRRRAWLTLLCWTWSSVGTGTYQASHASGQWRLHAAPSGQICEDFHFLQPLFHFVVHEQLRETRSPTALPRYRTPLVAICAPVARKTSWRVKLSLTRRIVLPQFVW